MSSIGSYYSKVVGGATQLSTAYTVAQENIDAEKRRKDEEAAKLARERKEVMARPKSLAANMLTGGDGIAMSSIPTAAQSLIGT